MTDHEQLETMLRSSLRERAGDVDTTPALYERVQRQATRGTWLRRGLALAGAAAAVVVAVTVVPALVPDQPLRPDVADTPPDVEPTEAPSHVAPGQVPDRVADQLLELGVAYAVDDGKGGSLLHVGGRTIASSQPILSMDAATSGASTALVVGFADGSLAGLDVGGSGEDFDQRIPAEANGAKAIITPGVDGVAWIEGTMLYVLPLADGAEARGLPLVGDVPGNLEIEDWTAQSDAQVVFASEPDGSVWRIPMDDSNIFNTAPTDPASVLDADAVDATLLADLTQVALRVPGDTHASLVIGTDVVNLGGGVSHPTAELAGNGQVVTLLDPTMQSVLLLHVMDDGTPHVWDWYDTGIAAAVSITGTSPAQPPPPGDAPWPTPDDASALGLPTDAPVVGTAGTDLLVRTADGQVQTIEVYPAAESEATLGRLAVRPGSTLEAGLVAVESFSEGENSIRLVALRDGDASPVGDILVTDGPVTGLVWSEDGTRIAWTDTAGLHESPLSDSGGLGGELLASDTGPVLDWVWTQVDGGAATGYFTMGVDGVTGVELLGIERATDETVALTGSVGGADRIVLSTHAIPGAAVGPEVTAAVGGGTAVLTWSADGDMAGALADPGIVGGDVRVQVSGGQVLVMGDSRQVLVTFDGQVLDLPTAADWDVLD